MHGLGASGHDFEPIVPVLKLPQVRFVFPHAPARGVTINGGLVMPAWYDILALATAGGEDADDVRESATMIEALIAREREAETSAANRTTPLLFCHGTLDPMVNISRARAAFAAYAEGRAEGQWHQFAMGHEVCPAEIALIGEWLSARFAR